MTKIEARIAKSNWAKALTEGRVVRFNDGASFKAFNTADDARAFVRASHSDQAIGPCDFTAVIVGAQS
jgi:hypothetical protein